MHRIFEMLPTRRLVTITVTMILSGCSGDKNLVSDTDGGEADTDGGEVRIGYGEGLYPADTLSDWVSWAVQVSAVTVLNEVELEPTPATIQRKEGYIGRRIRVRVDRTLWRANGSDPAPDEFSSFACGWVLFDGRKIRFALEKSVRLEVGGQYIMPITVVPVFQQPDSPGMRQPSSSESYELGWGPLSTEAPFPVRGNTVAEADFQARGSGAIAKDLATRSESEIGELLGQAVVNAEVRPYLDRNPWARWLAIYRGEGRVDAGGDDGATD